MSDAAKGALGAVGGAVVVAGGALLLSRVSRRRTGLARLRGLSTGSPGGAATATVKVEREGGGGESEPIPDGGADPHARCVERGTPCYGQDCPEGDRRVR